MTRTRSEPPATSELIEGILFYPIALVVSATIFPGFTLCIPGLLLATVLVVVPLAAVALVIALAAAVVMAPFVLVRAVRALLARHAESRRNRPPRQHAAARPWRTLNPIRPIRGEAVRR